MKLITDHGMIYVIIVLGGMCYVRMSLLVMCELYQNNK